MMNVPMEYRVMPMTLTIQWIDPSEVQPNRNKPSGSRNVAASAGRSWLSLIRVLDDAVERKERAVVGHNRIIITYD